SEERGGTPSGRLRTSREFGAALRGRRAPGDLMAVYVLPGGPGIRVGFVCGRRLGGAVSRNRARRLLREAWRSMADAVRAPVDVLFVGRGRLSEARLAPVQAEMRRI